MRKIVKLNLVNAPQNTVKYFPRNETALLFTQMLRSPTISPFVLQFIKRLGFIVEITPVSKKTTFQPLN